MDVGLSVVNGLRHRLSGRNESGIGIHRLGNGEQNQGSGQDSGTRIRTKSVTGIEIRNCTGSTIENGDEIGIYSKIV
ncbi:hypothetical protein EVAR_61036_1 [Eumeta japonica]|uniref:Uncharacterized protein n=1 Tax=Eumeta variegata TaxID=151549 RepID=A0A4C1ZKY9_EUMVA|nr:hypothetical protein EVAR_61036_1 [Eumeta japonica]